MTDRAQFVFGPEQYRQGIADKVIQVLINPFHEKRLKHNGKFHRLGLKIRNALREYAEFNAISTTDHKHWFQEAASLLSQDMLSVVLPMLPPIKFDGMDVDQVSLEEWARALRRLMNREATEQLIGTDLKVGPPDALRGVEAERVALLARMGSLALEIEFARRSGRLNEDDERAIEAFDAAESNEREAAKSINWTESRFRKRVQRIREKLA